MTVRDGGRTRHRCFDCARWTFRGVPSMLKERRMLRFLFASSTLDLMSSLGRGLNIVSSVPSKGVAYVASPRVLQAISSSDVSACGSMSGPAHYQLFHLAQWSQSRPLQDVCGRLRWRTIGASCLLGLEGRFSERFSPTLWPTSYDLKQTMGGVKVGSELLSADVHRVQGGDYTWR